MLWKRAKSVVHRPPSPGREEKAKKTDEHRTTITLKNPQLLRGCRPSVLLVDFGRRLRSTAGGIGAVAEEAENEYSHSFQPALCTGFSVGIASFLLQRRFSIDAHGSIDAILARIVKQEPSLHGCTLDHLAFCYSLLLGGVACIVTLLVWHNLRESFGGGLRIFLDKVCIHQTNAELKSAGIQSIGAVLASSKMVFVCWDTSYFSRLWCTYELSAYQKREGGRILVMPQDLGGFTVAATFVSVMHCVARFFVWRGVKVELVAGCAFVPLLLLMPRIRKYLQELEALTNQLETFSVKKTRCFCCDNNHRHPDTNLCMPCDREVVYKSIAHWHGDGNIEEGLEKFDLLVRKNLKRDMERTLGKAAKLPYKHALLVSMPPFFQAIDWHLSCSIMPSLFACVSQLVLRYPLCLALILFSIDVFKAQPFTKSCCFLSEDTCTRMMDAFIELGLAVLSFLIIFFFTVAGDYIFYDCVYEWMCIPWSILEAIAVVCLYWKNDSAVQNTQWTLQHVSKAAQAFAKTTSNIGDVTQTFSRTQSRSQYHQSFSVQPSEKNFELEMSAKSTWLTSSKGSRGAKSPRSLHASFASFDSNPMTPGSSNASQPGSSPATSQLRAVPSPRSALLSKKGSQSATPFLLPPSELMSPRSALSKKNSQSPSPFLMPTPEAMSVSFGPLLENSEEADSEE